MSHACYNARLLKIIALEYRNRESNLWWSQGLLSSWPYHSSSVNLSKILMLNIKTNNPMVTMISKAKPNQPRIIAAVPTPDFTLPLPKSCAIVLAATEAVCCHSTETSTKTLATNIKARAIWETGRDGKGLISRSEPWSSVSSCQPGKVASRIKQAKARTIATILSNTHVSGLTPFRTSLALGVTHIKYGKTIESLKVLATQIKLSGS